jgi:hypothetical protein
MGQAVWQPSIVGDEPGPLPIVASFHEFVTYMSYDCATPINGVAHVRIVLRVS